MTAKSELLEMSKIVEYGGPKLDIDELLSVVKQQIQSNLISQFALGKFFDKFQTGGGVDTIHNVREGTFSSNEVEAKLTKETSGYNQNVAKDFRGGSDRYKSINRFQTELKKSGKLVDPYTGKAIKRNAKTDLDHIIPLETVYEDKGRALAGVGVDEAANNKNNLQLTDSSINRSMGAASKKDYAKALAAKKEIWQKERTKIENNANLSADQKKVKLQNIDNKMSADAKEIEKAYRKANRSNNRQYNKNYYTSKEFLTSVTKNAGKQAANQGLKAAIGAVIYQASDMLFDVLVPILKNWRQYASMKERVADFKERTQAALSTLSERVQSVKDAALSGLGGGFFAALLNTVINTFLTTSKNIARLLNDLAKSAVMVFQTLRRSDDSVTKGDKIREASKIIATTLVATGGVILSGYLTAALSTTPFAPFAEIISTSISAIAAGLATGLIIYTIDNFSAVVAEFKQVMSNVVKGATVSMAEMNRVYHESLQKVDDLYQAILSEIYDEYAELNAIADLAFDMGISINRQFVASQKLAEKTGVEDKKILRSKSDVLNYLKS